MLRFHHLPAFASWLLHHIDDYTAEFVRLFYEVNPPLLKALSQLTEAQRFAYSKGLNTEFLTNLSQNNAAGHIDVVTGRWLAGQFENIGRLDVNAKDITSINYVRSKAQKAFINRYTADPVVVAELHSEIDELSFLYNTRSFTDYLHLLKEKIEQEGRFSRNIIEASPGIVFIYDLRQQKEIYINGRVEELTGYTPQEVLSEINLLMKLTYPDDAAKMNRFFLSLKNERKGKIQTTDYRFQVKNGEFHWMRCYAVVSKRSPSGEPEEVLCTAYDVSREKETALQLERSNEQLQQFAAVASHDLKEPLRKISLFANLILTADRDKLAETTKANLQRISDSAIRMQNLIEGVLSYSSVNTQPEKENVSLETLLQEAIQNLEYRIAETGAEITSDELPVAHVVPLQMQQLFQNLLANAMTFSKKNIAPKIYVSHSLVPSGEVEWEHLTPANHYLKIDITDNGIGFNSEAAEKIFGLFQRLHNRSDFEGYGMGLAICKRIVENHGGAISAVSKIDTGSTFTVVLPV